MRDRLDRFVELLARCLMRIFFRQVDVIGAERIPRGVPLVLVANHHNSLVDPLLVLGFLGAHPRFLAKSTLFSVPVLRWLLKLGGVIPVYRQQDAGEDTTNNQQTFRLCHEALARGGTVALFPEGISHDAPHLARMKTGAARIALGAETEHGALGLRVVPIGLTFDEKGRFRSRALIRVGAPLDPAAGKPAEPRAAARDLTERIGAGLRQVTLNYPSHEDKALLDRASELYHAGDRELPARMALTEAFAVQQAFIQGYERLRERHPARVSALRDQLARYQAALQRHQLRDDQVAARYPGALVWLYGLGTASLLLFWLPLAAIGTVLGWLPYRLLGLAARFTRSEDLPATVKLFGGFFLFPILWLLEAAAVGLAFGPLPAVSVAVLAPVAGYVAMLFHERHERFWQEATSFLWLMLRRGRARALRSERAALRGELRALAALEGDGAAADAPEKRGDPV